MIVGIDPGPGVTAVVVLQDARTVLGHQVYIKPDLDPHGLRQLVERIDDLVATCAYQHAAGLAAAKINIFVEDLNPPTPHLGMTNVRWLLDTATIIGALAVGLRPTPHLVAPGRYGTGPLAAYPAELRHPRETTGSGHGPYQHRRAAYDVALAGAAFRRLEVA